MTILQALILCIIQGLTELLPISSSGHLNIIPWLLNWTSNPEFEIAFEGFDVALHFGTLLAIGIFFFKHLSLNAIARHPSNSANLINAFSATFYTFCVPHRHIFATKLFETIKANYLPRIDNIPYVFSLQRSN